MVNIEIIKIKLHGIIGCIKKYTDEPSMRNLVEELERALKSNNMEIIIFCCKEIKDWYNKNINEILNNELVYNKSTHKDNLKILDEIIELLEENNGQYQEISNNIIEQDDDIFGKLINLLNKFHMIVRQLRDRHDSRETLDVSDEYDVQDLLHSLLYIYCDDVRDEEWTPSYAGKSSRQDFLLKKEKIVIETKMTRKGLSAKEVSDQLIIDIDRYKSHPDCKNLICFVYDPEERINNPRGIENDLTKITDDLNVITIITQK